MHGTPWLVGFLLANSPLWQVEASLPEPSGDGVTSRFAIPLINAPKTSGKTARDFEAVLGEVRADRMKFKAPRARQLVATEVTALKQLYQATPTAAPDRPQLMSRLALSYTELADAAQLEASKNPATPRQVEQKARKECLQLLEQLSQEYPKHSKHDQVLYFLSYAFEAAADQANARISYLKLIQTHPASPYVPLAYAAFGEMFFQSAHADPSKWSLAVASYEQVLKHPPPNNRFYGFALFRLGMVREQTGDKPRALEHYEKALEYTDKFPQATGAPELRRAALSKVPAHGP